METEVETRISRKRNYYEIKPQEIEAEIKTRFLEFASSHLLPLDLRDLKFEHKRSISTAICIQLHILCKGMINGKTLLQGIITSQGSNHNNLDAAYVIASCAVENSNI